MRGWIVVDRPRGARGDWSLVAQCAEYERALATARTVAQENSNLETAIFECIAIVRGAVTVEEMPIELGALRG